MEQISYPEIIWLIEDSNMDLAIKQLYRKMAKDCIPLIRSRVHQLTYNEALSVFYFAFLDLCGRIKNGSYEYRSDPSFESYFKTSCVNQSEKYRREFIPDMLVPTEFFEFIRDEAEHTIQEEEERFKAEKSEMGLLKHVIDDVVDTGARFDVMDEVVKVFHDLNDKCKFLIVLKFFLNLSHRQIVDSLHLFYGISSEDVCKTDLYRCLVQIRKKIKTENMFR
jgi:hypothetical protein